MMNLENYLSATLPSSVVSKIFEENAESKNQNNLKHKEDFLSLTSPAKRQKLDVENGINNRATKDDENEETNSLCENFQNFVGQNNIFGEASSEINREDDDTRSDNDDVDDEDDEFECDESNLVDILMDSFNAANPRELLSHMIPPYVQIPDNLDNYDICRLIFQMVTGEENLPKRHRLENINTIDNAVDLIKQSKNIIVLTGAGCSVACGIPDFRSRNGIYARLHKDFPDLPDPQSMFDIYYFQHNPKPFFKFAKEIYPGQFKPSLSHMFIKKIEENNKLLRNYTQNIDTIELIADIKNVVQCHGSFATATCTNQSCKYQVNADDIREIIFNQEIPKCQKCNEVGILKPDIVFFGESLPESYHKAILDDKSKCDLLIVIGSSLKVKPVAHIPNMLSEDVPQILINRESLKHMNFDVELLGDCDVIVKELLLRLGDDWTTVNDVKFSNDEKLQLIDDEKIIENLIVDCENSFSSSKSSENEKNDIESKKSENTSNIDLEKTIISSNLKDKTFLHLKPNVYVFHGAEIPVSTARKYLKGISDDKEKEYDEDVDQSEESDCEDDESNDSESDIDKDCCDDDTDDKESNLTKTSIITDNKTTTDQSVNLNQTEANVKTFDQ